MGVLFGTDGIRGEAHRFPMDADTAYAIGRAVVHVVGDSDRTPQIVVGRDTRISGPMLEDALSSGIVAAGGRPILAGVLPTAGIAFVTRSIGADAGVVVSASHNPYTDNGIKVFSAAGYKLSEEKEAEIEALVLGGREAFPADSGSPPRSPERLEDAADQYGSFLRSSFLTGLSLTGIKIAVDTANGATYLVGPAVLSALGADVTVIHDAPNGRNINENCGSEHTGDLERTVKETGAAIGLAFDGDGDRLVAVDEEGRTLTGDQILIICAHRLKEEGRLKHDLVVSTVMSNMGLRVACKQYGFQYHAARVGDRHVLEEMQRLGAVLGGEDSGHMILLEHHTTGDGILAALQLLAAMRGTGKPLSELSRLMTVFPQTLVNVDVTRKPDLGSVPQIVEAIADAEARLKDEGRVLVRYSGTQDMCRVMVEGPTQEITKQYAERIAHVVRATLG